MGTIIIVAVFSNFILAGKGSVWKHRNFLNWGIRPVLCPCAGVSFFVSLHLHLTCSMCVRVVFSCPVCRMRDSSSGKGSKACVTKSVPLWGPALESSASGSRKSWCLPCSGPLGLSSAGPGWVALSEFLAGQGFVCDTYKWKMILRGKQGVSFRGGDYP